MRLSPASSIVLALAFAAASPALAQSNPNPGPAAPPPARVGNTYDHKHHQPTESDAGAAEQAGSSKQQVEREVQELLDQTDRLDRQSEQLEQPAPAGSSSRAPGGR
jgi:hypothetical protein